MNIHTNTLSFDQNTALLFGEVIATNDGDAEAIVSIDLPLPAMTVVLQPGQHLDGTVVVSLSRQGGAVWCKPAGPGGSSWCIGMHVPGDVNRDGTVDGSDLGLCLSDWASHGGAALGELLANTGKNEKVATWGAISLAGAGTVNSNFQPLANHPLTIDGESTFRVRMTVSPKTEFRFVIDAVLKAPAP